MIASSNIHCGIVDIGLCLPQHIRTHEEIAALSGIPDRVVQEKFGINKVYCPGQDDHTSDLAVRAAQDCLKRSGIDPAQIDLVIYFGENYSDYQLFNIAPKVIRSIGAVNAWGYDLECKCSSFVVALDQAKKYLLTEDCMDTVMLVAGYRNVDKVDYNDHSISFLFNLSCAGAAAIVKKGHDKHVILSNANIADTRFAESIYVPGGGSKYPFTPDNIHDTRLRSFRLNDSEWFRQALGAVTLDNLVKVTKMACEKSGLSASDIDFACLLHMKASAHRQVLKDLAIDMEKSVYLSDFGHCGQLDGPIALRAAMDAGRLREGDIVALITMGFGYMWNAGILTW